MQYRRPLADEPLALDLVNTAWPEDGGWRDMLADRRGHEQWLRENGLAGPASPPARRALREARDAITVALEQPRPAALAGLDRILERGRIRLRADTPAAREALEIAAEWRAPWLAVRSLLQLLDQQPGRVRKCANPDCTFWFLDTTRSGTRRWCTMAACGNRLKARRRYRRQHPG